VAWAAIACTDNSLAVQASDPATVETPRAVVAKWLELHRTGKRDAAALLARDTIDHRARYELSSKRDTGVRVARALGNEQVTAVVTTALPPERKRVLLFWLQRDNRAWRIAKSYSLPRKTADERLRGFLESGDVRWHVRRQDVVGLWTSGPCTLPGDRQGGCGSRFQLGKDNRYKLVSWGPAGPQEEEEGDHVVRGRWRMANGAVLLSHNKQTYEYKVYWMADNRLDFRSDDGTLRVEYIRSHEQAANQAVKLRAHVDVKKDRRVMLRLVYTGGVKGWDAGYSVSKDGHLMVVNNATFVLKDSKGKVISPREDSITTVAANARLPKPFDLTFDLSKLYDLKAGQYLVEWGCTSAKTLTTRIRIDR